jgi:cobyrinic acid a,c-diamide synthase
MIASLRRYAQAGGRVYGEGGAIAYLSHQVELENGMRTPMTGLLPAIARYNQQAGTPTPTEVTVARDWWFAKAGDCLRGYQNSRWRIEPLAPIGSLVDEPAQRFDLLRADNVIASSINLNLVGHPNLLASFLALAAAPTR